MAKAASAEGVVGENHTRWISEKIDPVSIFRDASKNWDGGYALAGILGTGDCFAMRDPNGIRPGFYFEDEEVFAVASERAPLMTVFDKSVDDISEIQPGGILVMRPNGELIKKNFVKVPQNYLVVHSSVFIFHGGMTRYLCGKKNALVHCLFHKSWNLWETIFLRVYSVMSPILLRVRITDLWSSYVWSGELR